MTAHTAPFTGNPARSTLELRIAGLQRLADGVKEITFVTAADGSAPLPAWTPGAHVSFRITPQIERQYSLCSSAGEAHLWRVAVLHTEESRGGSSTIHANWKVGDLIEASPPRNHFPLDEAESYLFIAGGIGITPMLPMIEEAQRRGSPWQLVYGGRSRSSMAYLDRISEWGDQAWIMPEDEVGRPDLRALTADLPEGCLVYSCGPEGLLNALSELATAWRPNQLRLERFAPVTQVSDEEDRPFTAHLRESGLTIQVGAGESLLEAMAREGVHRPAACREGTCGTCETRVLSGGVLHRCSVLSDAEREAGEWMMACVSRALHAEIELDA